MRFWWHARYSDAIVDSRVFSHRSRGGEGGKNSTFDNLGKLDNVFLEFQQRFNVTQHFEIFQKIELNRCSANFRDPQYIFIGKRTTKRRQNDPKYRYSPTNESVGLHRKVVARRIKSSLNRRATRAPVISQSSRIVWYYGIVMDDTRSTRKGTGRVGTWRQSSRPR